jgi:hypothetical protein
LSGDLDGSERVDVSHRVHMTAEEQVRAAVVLSEVGNNPDVGAPGPRFFDLVLFDLFKNEACVGHDSLPSISASAIGACHGAMAASGSLKCCLIVGDGVITTLMSKGPGRIERAIETAFRANPDGYFSVGDIAALAYPGEYINRAKREAALRAAQKVAGRLYWVVFYGSKRGNPAIFANGLSLQSYALGCIRASFGGPFGGIRNGRVISLEERLRCAK